MNVPVNHMNMNSIRLLLVLVIPGATLPAWSTTAPFAPPDLVIAERDGVVAVEAEHFIRQERVETRAWHVITRESAPAVEPDGDPSHAEAASGGAYLEILPDTRRTHDDAKVDGGNFSNIPGRLAILSYRVRFEQPGRYYFWARVFSTGTEDNGVHVGLDGEWPASGQRWQTTKKHAWHWDCRQRTAENHQGVPMQLWLDVPTAGEHTVQLSMREDGFELDKWILARAADFRPAGEGPPPAIARGALPNRPHVAPPPAAED